MYSYTSGHSKGEVYFQKGRAAAGNAIGIIVPTGFWFPPFPGNIINATTFDFPVHYKYLESVDINQQLLTTEPDSIFLEKTIKAGKELEEQGCRAVIGCCGYFANYLTEVAAALNIPCFLSSLIQIPTISRAIKPSQKIGIICANGRVLASAPALKKCGVDDMSKVVIAGAEGLSQMQNVLRNTGHLDSEKFEQELVGLAKETVDKNPDIGALLLECTEMPPYAHAIQEAVKLPVFDYTTLINWVYNAVVRRPFAGFI